VVGFVRRNQADPPAMNFALRPQALGLKPEYQLSANGFLEMIARL
jgi:hypothetical protein